MAGFNGGVIYEDASTSGLFTLMANSFWRGTKNRPYPDLMREMDGIGMSLGASSHNNVWFVRMQSLADEVDPALGVFADVLTAPAIDPAWVDRLKGYILTQVLPNRAVDADQIAQETLRANLYVESPYRRDAFGTPESVASFDVAKVRDLYEKFGRPNNCVLAVYGDIDLDRTEALVRRLFDGWEKGEIPHSLVTEDPGLAESKTIELVNRQVRTNYVLGWRAFGRQDQERRAAVAVMSAIMGARGWLHQRLREGSADYVYSVYSAAYPGDQVGHFFIDTDFQPKDETKVLSIIDGVVADMKAGHFTDDDLALAKTMLVCDEALQKKDLDSLAEGDALNVLYGEGLDADAKFYARVKAVTRDDVVKVAEEIFSRPECRILVRPKVEQTGPAPASSPAGS